MIVVSSMQQLKQHRRVWRVVIACGVFDGVHCGHQAILRQLVGLARRQRATPVVLTFSPHPRSVLKSSPSPPLLTNRQQKLELLDQHGVEAVVIVEFNTAVAALPPIRFAMQYLLVDGPPLAGICVGSNWRFGADGRGDTKTLEQLGRQHNFPVISVPELYWYGQPISSTRIRQKIEQGDLSPVTRMLGRFHSLRGRIVRGRGIASSRLACPTANLVADDGMWPPPGVYAVHLLLDTDQPPAQRTETLGVAYVGTAPTMDEGDAGDGSGGKRIECHFFDLGQELYQREIEVGFVSFIRPERKFADPTRLAEQIQRDIVEARRRLATASTGKEPGGR